MANQTRLLLRMLTASGARVAFVATNPPYAPAWAGRVRGLRAVARLIPYMRALWQAAGDADVAHVMASSGWAWHLFAAPAVWIVRARGVPVIVNYRGGGAEAFFARWFPIVRPTLRRAAVVVVPSSFLERIFAARGVATAVVPNLIDDRWLAAPPSAKSAPATPHLVVARNLEEIYDIGTAIQAFARVRACSPGATLSIAGMGPERASLERLALEVSPDGAIRFLGRLENERMLDLFGTATVVLNPSRVDNMPISILEALAAGVPVVTTNVGGIPALVENGVTALLVDPKDPVAMADAALRLDRDPELRARLVQNGRNLVDSFTWTRIGPLLGAVYDRARRRDEGTAT
jgi:glycosyltransferase involved in cell wall biosynthesis